MLLLAFVVNFACLISCRALFFNCCPSQESSNTVRSDFDSGEVKKRKLIKITGTYQYLTNGYSNFPKCSTKKMALGINDAVYEYDAVSYSRINKSVK